MAYSISATGMHPDMFEEEEEENEHEGEESSDDIDEMERIAAQIAADNVATLKANALFMRLVLQSQMINEKKAAHLMHTTWEIIGGCIPQLNPSEVDKVKEVFATNWDLILELFHHYAPSGYMNQEEFTAFMDESEMFGVVDAATQIAKVYSRTLKYTAADESTFNFSCLLVALIVCAQIKYNDTMNSKGGGIKRSYEAVFDLFENNFIPLSEHLSLKATLKNEFCSDPCMAKTRELYESLLQMFNKYALKTRDVAYTLPFEEVAELFHKSGLLDKPDNLQPIKDLFEEVRLGTIYGRELQTNAEDDFPENEFAFPEFLEATARAGFRRFHGVEMKAGDLPFDCKELDANEGIMFTITECMIKGFECVVESANVKLTASASAKGRKKSGNASGGHRK